MNFVRTQFFLNITIFVQCTVHRYENIFWNIFEILIQKYNTYYSSISLFLLGTRRTRGSGRTGWATADGRPRLGWSRIRSWRSRIQPWRARVRSRRSLAWSWVWALFQAGIPSSWRLGVSATWWLGWWLPPRVRASPRFRRPTSPPSLMIYASAHPWTLSLLVTNTVLIFSNTDNLHVLEICNIHAYQL